MLGKSYFEHRLGDIYKYSRIPYQHGEGFLGCTKYCWELCVDICGNIIFVLSTDNCDDFSHLFPKNQWSNFFCGKSNDGVWYLKCTDIKVTKKTLKSNIEFDFVRANSENNKKLVLFCLPNSIEIERTPELTITPTLVKAYFSNFDFIGVRSNREFKLDINNKIISFKMLENSKQVVELIDIGRIDNAILSEASIPLNQDLSIQSIEEEIISISWFLSFLNVNLTLVPIVEYFANGEIIKYSIENTAKSSFHRKYIIDNFNIEAGILTAFNTCYSNYKDWKNKIEINNFLHYLSEINQTKYIDIKLATMIMAYEYLLTKYLIHENKLEPNDVKKSIQLKLKLINNKLRLNIPSKMIKSNNNKDLRKPVRNRLFHQGEIPSMNSAEKIEFFKKYYDLLIRIILKILNYQGKYISVETREPTEISYKKIQ